MMKRLVAAAIFAVGGVIGMIGVIGCWAHPVLAQNCNDVAVLLNNGNTMQQIIAITGLTAQQVNECRIAQQPRVYSPEGPPPLGAAGPPPRGAAGPPPLGAAGPPPRGAAGPAPFGTH